MKNQIIEIITNHPQNEDNKTMRLFELRPQILEQGFLTKDQAMGILCWKSSRPKRFYDLNTEDDFQTVTRIALEQESSRLQVHILTALNGVKYPAASAILMFVNPEINPVIDIRVWQQLYNFGLVTQNESGRSLTLNQWDEYIAVVRELAKECGITARQVEKRLFHYDVEVREGKLYG